MTTRIKVDPGICGFTTEIEAEKIDKRRVAIRITSNCQQVQGLVTTLGEIELKDVFQPISSSPVYNAASECHLHPTCSVPVAILKAAECEMGLALQKNAALEFIKQPTPIDKEQPK